MMDTILQWKRVWQTVSGVSEAVTETDVADVLNAAKNDLLLGLSKFTPYSDESLELWRNIVRIGNISQLEKIIARIARTINLNVQLTWPMFCNFLMFVYHGKVEDVQKIADIEMQMANLVEVFQNYYSMERIFCLKTLHYVINNFNNEYCRFQKCYSMFIADVSIIKIRASLIKQLAQLHEELLTYQYNNKNPHLNHAANEMTEIFLLLVASSKKWEICPRQVDYFATNLQQFVEQLVQLVELCGHRQYESLNHTDMNKGTIIQNLNNARIAAILVPFVELFNILERKLFENDCLEWWDVHYKRLECVFSRKSCTGVLLLQWTLLGTITSNEIEMKTNFNQEEIYLNRIISSAVNEMTNICTSKFIENSAEVHQIRFSIYKTFQQLYTRVEVKDNFWYLIDAIPLLVALLRDKDIAINILRSTSPDEDLKQLITLSELRFPNDFKSFTSLLRAQLPHKEFQEQVLEKLKNLIYFKEVTYDTPSEFPYYKTIQNNFSMIETNIIGQCHYLRRNGRTTVVFVTNSYAYIDVLHHIITYLLSKNNNKYEFIDPKHSIILEALEGLDLLIEVLKFDIQFATSNVMDAILNQLFRMVALYLPRDKYNHEIIIRCLKVFVQMMPLKGEKILYYLSLNSILPIVSVDELAIIDDTLLRIANQDSSNHMQNVVTFIVDMIQQCFNAPTDHCRKIQLPLAMFLFQKLLPMFTLIWRRDIDAKLMPIVSIFEFLQDILQNGCTSVSGDIFQSECLEMVLTNPSFIQEFFIIFGNIKSTLEEAVLFQSNWETPYNHGVQLSNLCVNIILLVIQKTEGSTNELLRQPFGAACIKTNIQIMNNFKIIAGLINNSLDSNLSITSCRLLTKFAQNSNIPMLAHLDMDSNQVRGTFLEKLRDPLESNSLKVAIIDLIAASIKAQYGLTVVFFNVPELRDKPIDLSDNLSSFVMEFLKNIEKLPEYLCTPLGQSILNLILQLWKVNDVNLTTSLTDIRNFWAYLTCPLFTELKLESDIYSKIITILYMHLKRNTEYTTNFDLIIDNMFRFRTEILIVKLFEHIRNRTPTATDLELLLSLNKLLMMLILKKPKLFEANGIRRDIAFNCLKGLQVHIKESCESQIITTWSATYLYVLNKWENSCLTDFNKEFSLLTDTFNCFSNNYQSIAINCQENLLAIACSIIQLLKKQNDRVPNTFKPFLDVMQIIMVKEVSLFAVLELVSKNWMFLLTFSSHLLDLDWVSIYKALFDNSNFLYYVFTTVTRCIKKQETLPIARIAMETLVKYATSSMYLDITISDLELFYYNINPPAKFLHIASHDFNPNAPWPFEVFWLTYTDLMHLNVMLLRRSPYRYLSSCFTFFAMHWLEIEALIVLPSYTVELAALELVQSILDFGCELLQFREEWQRSEMGSRSMMQFFEMINRCLNSCIEIMTSPNILKFFSCNKLELIRTENIPSIHFINIMNRLLQIITISSLCYNKVNPIMIPLLNPSTINSEIQDVITIQCEFSIPQISKGIKNRLSYGGLLCLVQILCNSLTQRLSRQDTDVNISSDVTKMSICQNEPICYPNILTFDNVLGFVCPNFLADVDENKEELNWYSVPWLNKLNLDYTSCALEALSTYLASQISLLVTHDQSKTIDSSYYRWSLSMELHKFQEYAMKRYKDACNIGITSQISHRGHPVHYIMPPKQLQKRDRRSISSDSDDSGSECSNWGIAPDVNPSFPEAFIAWRDSQLKDNFIKPCFPEYEVVDEMVSEEYYLLMISHWFRNICNLGD